MTNLSVSSPSIAEAVPRATWDTKHGKRLLQRRTLKLAPEIATPTPVETR
jgi:hypothetical protein